MSAPVSNPGAPVVIDALTLARSGAGFEHAFREQRFPRLSGLIVSDRPALEVKLRFELQRGRPVIYGQLDGAVELICQRCMRPMRYALNEKFALLVSDADSELRGSTDDEVEAAVTDMEEWVADATRIDVAELAEEQVILALPLVPKHEDEQVCLQAEKKPARIHAETPDERFDAEADAGEGMRRPFANLRELLKK